MSHDTPDIDLMSFVAYPSHQSVFVIADIEDRAVAVNVRTAKRRTDVRKCPPVSVGCDVIPGIERDPTLRMEFVELPDSSIRYNSHPRLSSLGLTIAELTVGSHIGNLLSRRVKISSRFAGQSERIESNI